MFYYIYINENNMVCWDNLYVFILQQDNTQNIKPEGQQGSEALTAARNKKCLEQILATTNILARTIVKQPENHNLKFEMWV